MSTGAHRPEGCRADPVGTSRIVTAAATAKVAQLTVKTRSGKSWKITGRIA